MRFDRFRKVAVCLSVVVIVCLLLVKPSHAQTKTVYWRVWDVDVVINSDGSFWVTETYEIDFVGGDFTFGFAEIFRNKLESIEDIRVLEGSREYEPGQLALPYTFLVEEGSEKYRIEYYFPPLRDETRKFVIQYRVVGGLFIDETGDIGDRLQWIAVRDHSVAIDSVSLSVNAPEGTSFDQSIGVFCMSLPGTPTTESLVASYTPDGRTFSCRAEYVPTYGQIEVGVRWPTGFVSSEKPSWQSAYEREQYIREQVAPTVNLAVGALSVLAAIVGLIGVYALWLFKGRDPHSGVVPKYVTEPPSSLPAGVVGTLVDERADLRDIIATLIDLARRGAITMEEQERSLWKGFSGKREFTFTRNKEFDGKLFAYESLLLKRVFGSKSSVDLSDLNERFYTYVSSIKKAMYKEVVSQGLFPQSPEAVRNQWIGIGVLGLFGSFGCGFVLTFVTGGLFDGALSSLICLPLVFGLVSGGFIAISQVMPVKTETGSREAQLWEAFRTYLKNIERHSELSDVTDLFDKYLPYAIAFGLEHSWVSKFSRIKTTPTPSWYIPYRRYSPHVGSGGTPVATGRGGRASSPDSLGGDGVSLDSLSGGLAGGLSEMSSGLTSMLNQTARTFTSSPSSSGSGGYSGGGFSSGGFSSGGGGGGGSSGFG